MDRMKLVTSDIVNLIAIGAVIFAGCWDYEPKIEPSTPKPNNHAIAMCIDTNDSTTYSKRIDIKIACFSSIDSCVEYAEQSCPDGLKPLQVWLENE